MNIGPCTFDEYLEKVRVFHGRVEPGMVAGGFMVGLAKENLPEGEFFDVICETAHCLPDAVQILTPCTIGNGWLRIIETSRFALTMHEKYKGEGIRVFMDLAKLDIWPEIRCWLLKEKPKHKLDMGLIIEEIREAETTIYSLERVRIKPEILQGKRKYGSGVAPCPSCGEAYRSDLGNLCPACRGKGPYIER